MARGWGAGRSVALVGEWVEAGGLLSVGTTAAAATAKPATAAATEAAVEGKDREHSEDDDGDDDGPSGAEDCQHLAAKGKGTRVNGWIGFG